MLLSVACLLSSCSTSKNIVYFQDLHPGESEVVIADSLEIRVRPEDKISIIVNSRDPQLTDLFNLPYVTRQLGQSSLRGSVGYNQGVSGYTVDDQGNIDFPVLGKIHVAGMKRVEIASYIKDELVSKNLVKDPVVTVEFMNLCFSVMGEVNAPGRFNIDRDRLTILDALSMAGDLTIYGNREKVLVLRQEGNTQRVYGVNLTSGEHIYTSPAYHLQQNDVVYVEPAPARIDELTYNERRSFSVSLASIIVSSASVLTSLVIALTK